MSGLSAVAAPIAPIVGPEFSRHKPLHPLPLSRVSNGFAVMNAQWKMAPPGMQTVSVTMVGRTACSANVLLAAGASPAMIHTSEETPDFAKIVGSLIRGV